jgi:hypothetical protein
MVEQMDKIIIHKTILEELEDPLPLYLLLMNLDS